MEILAVVNAEVVAHDVWAEDRKLYWIALASDDTHRATAIVDTDERVWALELFPDPETPLVWIDPEFDLTLPGKLLNHSECLQIARELMPDDPT